MGVGKSSRIPSRRLLSPALIRTRSLISIILPPKHRRNMTGTSTPLLVGIYKRLVVSDSETAASRTITFQRPQMGLLLDEPDPELSDLDAVLYVRAARVLWARCSAIRLHWRTPRSSGNIVSRSDSRLDFRIGTKRFPQSQTHIVRDRVAVFDIQARDQTRTDPSCGTIVHDSDSAWTLRTRGLTD